jgi:hypothetical protein
MNVFLTVLVLSGKNLRPEEQSSKSTFRKHEIITMHIVVIVRSLGVWSNYQVVGEGR